MRRTHLWAAVAAAAMLTGACKSASSLGATQADASTSAPSATHSAPTTAPTVAGTRTSEQLCKDAVAPAVLLDWAPGSAPQVRAQGCPSEPGIGKRIRAPSPAGQQGRPHPCK